MAEYDFDTDEVQYFLLADELKGMQIAKDDGKANYLYIKGEGYQENAALLDYVWPNSPKFGLAKSITEEQAEEFTRRYEAGEMMYDIYRDVIGEDPKPEKRPTWESLEEESNIAEGMSMDEMYEAWKNMLD